VKSRIHAALLVISVLACAAAPAAAKDAAPGIRKGDKLQLLANLHPDVSRQLLYTLNYQLPSMIPVCSEATFTAVGSRRASFVVAGQPYDIQYDNFTKGAGVSFQKVLMTYFGPACDKSKMEKLDSVDQDGIRSGRPHTGMTRDGILFAMGRPPYHANPNLDVGVWVYWRNRYGKMELEFDASGKVTAIR
jgi:hypothetical protein